MALRFRGSRFSLCSEALWLRPPRFPGSVALISVALSFPVALRLCGSEAPISVAPWFCGSEACPPLEGSEALSFPVVPRFYLLLRF
jgi:hypothetical protein